MNGAGPAWLLESRDAAQRCTLLILIRAPRTRLASRSCRRNNLAVRPIPPPACIRVLPIYDIIPLRPAPGILSIHHKMPPRRKPASTKQRKAQLQLKRAIKRGDVEAPPPQSAKSRGKGRRPLPGRSATDPSAAATASRVESSRKLQSAFLRLSPSFLALSKQLASTVPLPRPIPDDAIHLAESISNAQNALTCPKRPKWRYDMEKKEVEKNEDVIFKKWEKEVAEKVELWRNADQEANQEGSEGQAIPKSPTYYERNLEVWRQLYVRANFLSIHFRAFLILYQLAGYRNLFHFTSLTRRAMPTGSLPTISPHIPHLPRTGPENHPHPHQSRYCRRGPRIRMETMARDAI